MDYISVDEAAKKWGIVKRRVQFYCANNKIPGAINMGKQWIIPADAQRPADGRRKNTNTLQLNEDYHFPILVHTRFYTSRKALSPDELRLLDAQIEHLYGNHVNSITMCRELLNTSDISSVKIGAYYTIGVCAMLMGMHTELKTAIKDMENLCKYEGLHSEDYKLIIANLKFNYTWDPKELFAIDIAKLSPESLYYYQQSILLAELFGISSETAFAVRFYEIYCKQLELEGLIPTLTIVHALLAHFYLEAGDLEMRNMHLEECCKLAIENNWIGYLVKCSACDISGVQGIMTQKYPQRLEELNIASDNHLKSWQLISGAERGLKFLGKYDAEDSELLLLLAHNLSNKEIAAALGVSVNAVENKIKDLCKKESKNTKTELCKFARSLFDVH